MDETELVNAYRQASMGERKALFAEPGFEDGFFRFLEANAEERKKFRKTVERMMTKGPNRRRVLMALDRMDREGQK